MRRTTVLAMVAVGLTSVAHAETVAPMNVVFEDGAVAQSLTGMAGNPEAGEKIMNKGAGNCIACHQVTSLDYLAFQGEIGPPLDGVADRWSEAEIRGIVANAKIMFEDSMMPSFYKTDGFVRLGNAFTGKAHEGDVEPLLSAQDVEDVVAYLLTLTE